MDTLLRTIDQVSEAHLIVGIVGPVGDHYDGRLGPLFELLIEAQGAEGSFSVGELQTGDHLALHCAFELKADADKFAVALQATRSDRYPGFASERQFMVKSAVINAISNVLQERVLESVTNRPRAAMTPAYRIPERCL